jgi:hypothetical protein
MENSKLGSALGAIRSFNTTFLVSFVAIKQFIKKIVILHQIFIQPSCTQHFLDVSFLVLGKLGVDKVFGHLLRGLDHQLGQVRAIALIGTRRVSQVLHGGRVLSHEHLALELHARLSSKCLVWVGNVKGQSIPRGLANLQIKALRGIQSSLASFFSNNDVQFSCVDIEVAWKIVTLQRADFIDFILFHFPISPLVIGIGLSIFAISTSGLEVKGVTYV